MDWKQTTAFIEEVESGKSQMIARRNLPLMMGVGIAMMAGGAIELRMLFRFYIEGISS